MLQFEKHNLKSPELQGEDCSNPDGKMNKYLDKKY